MTQISATAAGVLATNRSQDTNCNTNDALKNIYLNCTVEAVCHLFLWSEILSCYPAGMDVPQISCSRRATFENDNTWVPGRTWRAASVFRPTVTCCHLVQSHLFKDVENL